MPTRKAIVLFIDWNTSGDYPAERMVPTLISKALHAFRPQARPRNSLPCIWCLVGVDIGVMQRCTSSMDVVTSLVTDFVSFKGMVLARRLYGEAG